MNDERKRGDDLVADYLAGVRDAGAGLTPARREELVEDLREHIAAARAELETETEADVRTLLDRLGEPAAIAAEAAVGEPLPAPPPPVAPPPDRSNRTLVTVLVVVLAAVVLLPVAVCVLGGLFFVTSDAGVEQIPAPVVSHMPVPSRSPS